MVLASKLILIYMFVRGDTIVIYGGYIDSSEERTTVEIATVLEVGRHELLVSLDNKRWGGPVKVSISNCERIEGKFQGIKNIPFPIVGDLVLVHKYDVVSSDVTKKVGTVQAVQMTAGKHLVHVLIEGNIKKIPVEECMIL